MAATLDLPRRTLRRREVAISLRSKGLIAVCIVVGAVLLTGLYVAGERQGLVRIVQEVETNNAMQGMVGTVINRLARAILEPTDQAPTARDPQLKLALERVRETLPALDQEVRDLEAMLDLPRSRLTTEMAAELRDREQQLIGKLHELLNSLQRRSGELASEYRDSQRAISLAIITTHVAAVLGSVTAVLIFFTRIARDIKALQDRAVAIVNGYSGPPLANRRGDEIGGLIDAVNLMQVDLRRHERQREVTREQMFHQEKMAAVGSIASAIGHEVSNPIAAISGVAQFMVDETAKEESEKGKALHGFASEIVRQSERITLILRQLGTLTSAPSPEPRLLDLNALVRTTCGFIGYDKRFRGVEFDFDLDPDLPAVTAVADHLTQVLMNLLINAADAMDNGDTRRIVISTRRDGDFIRVDIRDNGHGMEAGVLARAFDESFTTKPPGKGRGIGLYLCKTLMEEAGGRIALESSPGVGTTATLHLPGA